MQGFPEKPFSKCSPYFPSFQIFLDLKSSIFHSYAECSIKKKVPAAKGRCCDEVMCIQYCCFLFTSDCSRVVLLPGTDVIFKFLCSIHLSMKFILLINVKMPTIICTLTYISMDKTPSEFER